MVAGGNKGDKLRDNINKQGIKQEGYINGVQIYFLSFNYSQISPAGLLVKGPIVSTKGLQPS